MSQQLVRSAQSSCGEGSEGLLCPWATLSLEEEKQLQAGQRWKGVESLAQGEQH